MRKSVWAGIAVVGLLLTVAFWSDGSSSTGPSAQKGETRPVSLVISGAVKLPPGQRARATLHFRMPEVPLGLVRNCAGLVDKMGRYRLEYEFEGPRAPTYLQASLRVDGQLVDQAQRVALSGDPLGAEVPLLAVPEGPVQQSLGSDP